MEEPACPCPCWGLGGWHGGVGLYKLLLAEVLLQHHVTARESGGASCN